MKPPKCILLDIEGTTSSISFVVDVMFPWVRENIDDFLRRNWSSDTVSDCLPLLAAESGQASVETWLNIDRLDAIEQVKSSVLEMMDADIKATGLKQLQGAIWRDGFESGQLVAHVYNDVVPAIRRWNAAGAEVRIYSSGSVQAQRLFFRHSIVGDLLPLFSGHYDTTIGSKKNAASYRAISSDAGLNPNDMLFISDITEELDAAMAVGMATVLSIRPGNQSVTNQHGHRSIHQFDELDFSRCTADAND